MMLFNLSIYSTGLKGNEIVRNCNKITSQFFDMYVKQLIYDFIIAQSFYIVNFSNLISYGSNLAPLLITYITKTWNIINALQGYPIHIIDSYLINIYKRYSNELRENLECLVFIFLRIFIPRLSTYKNYN